MSSPKDRLERLHGTMEILLSYGEEFLVFLPEDQPNVFSEPEVPPATS